MKKINFYKKLFLYSIIINAFSCSSFLPLAQKEIDKTKHDRKAAILFIAQQKDTISRLFIFHSNNFFELLESSIKTKKSYHTQNYLYGAYNDTLDSITLKYNGTFFQSDIKSLYWNFLRDSLTSYNHLNSKIIIFKGRRKYE